MHNPRSPEATPPTTIDEVLTRLAAEHPAGTALLTPNRAPLGYSALAAQIATVGRQLTAWGIRPGDIVAGVVLSRPELAVALAVLPVSATFAPLAPNLTADACRDLMVRLGPKAVLVERGSTHVIRQVAEACDIALIELIAHPSAATGTFELELLRSSRSLERTATALAQDAYVLATSGTTGQSKLVPIGHREVIAYAQAAHDTLGFTFSDVNCHQSPLHWAGGMRTTLLNPLLHGAATVVLPQSDVDAFYRSLDDFSVTVASHAFAMAREILHRAADFGPALQRHKLRFLRVSSGRIEATDVDRLEQLFGVPVLVGYSATEVGSISQDRLPPQRRKPGAAGLPQGNEVGILNDAGRIGGTDTAGEILVRGPLVFRGYLDDPALTAQSFVDEWYRTGDLGCIDTDGFVYVSGRLKDIINRGGEKISPAGIDTALQGVAGIREGAAFSVPHPTLGEEVVAAVVRDAGSLIGQDEILAALRLSIGPSRLPRRVYFVDQLPKTDAGKVRRDALRQMLTGPADRVGGSSADPIEPSPIESALISLWKSVLHVPAIQRDDDFFLLGGDSLRGANLLRNVALLFKVEISLEALFGEAATIAGMARTIGTARGAAAASRRPNVISPRSGTGPVTLTHTQQRAWFLAQLDPDSTAYHEARAYSLRGPLDITALKESLRALITRHEILRTTYATVGDEPRQFVHDEPTVDLEVLDRTSRAGLERAEVLAETLAEATREPFDLSRGPLLHLRVIRLGENHHVLLRIWHHINSDGWSAQVFDRELSALYKAQIEGNPAPLPPLPIQYADYALWQREWLTGPVLGQQLAYWKQQLAGLVTLELPTDRPRPALQSYRGARLEVELPDALNAGLKALGRQEGATLYMAGLAAFNVLLYRYTGNTDIAIGTPIAGRGRLELEGLIGFFANTLVLRSDLSGAPTFRQVLARVRETALAAYTHQDVPFEKLVEVLAPARDLSRNPLFQVCFAVQNMAARDLTLQHLTVSRVALPTEHAKFDLSLDLLERDGGFHASFEYCTDLFEKKTIERLAEHFGVLLEALLARPDEPIDTLPLMSAAERYRLLVEWNETAVAYPQDQTLAALFEAQVLRSPGAVALIQADRSVSYAQLNARANQLAHYLRERSVGPDVPVAICMERSADCLVAILAILKAGAAYLPLDPHYPQDRISFMLTDANVPLVLVHGATRERFAGHDPRVLCVDADQIVISRCPASNGPAPARPEDLAYIIYTSGSTGVPKGVQILQRGICNHLHWISSLLQLSATDRVLHFTSISFDASVWEMLAPLQIGASLYLAKPGDERDMACLARVIDEQQLTGLQVVPSMLRALLAEAQLERCRSLRYLVCGGEALDFELVGRVRDQLPWVRLGNYYGPTEASIDATYLDIEPHLQGTGIVPIGRPIANVRCHVLDGRLQPVPIGVIGELYIGGAGLARGYVNRPELTAERFIADPFRSGERLYRTGDRVRYLPDGTLAFAGRNDDQVKIRGYRIELGEIEAALGGCAGVRHAVVLAREDQPGLKRLVAYVAGESLTRESLLAQLKDRLPDYMVPTAIVFLEHLPRLPNGKLDRRALPEPDYEQIKAPGGYSAPGTAMEGLLSEVWAELLGLPRVGVHDDFFALGGHSLLAGQLAARLMRVCGVEVPLRWIFEKPTVAGLAREIERLLGAGPSAQAHEKAQPIVPVARLGPLPLSFAQQRLWFIDQLSPGTGTYNLPTVLRLRGNLQPQALRESLDVLIARHESLRTRMATVDGEARQIIAAASPVALDEQDLQALGEQAAPVRARELAQEEAERPFDLAQGPLLRVLLIRLAEQEHVLVINLHHIISDGWSGGVFDRELSALYNGHLAGQPAQLADLPIQYADYALWQRAWLAGPVLEQQLRYWKTQLAGLATLELPIDRPRPALQSFRGARLEIPLPDTLGAGLRALGREAGSTLFMAGLAAFKVLLYRYSGGTDLAIGTPIAGRGRVELEGLIGFFANTLVLRTDLSGGPTFRQLLARVRETTLGAYTHQDLPFEKLVEELAPRRDPSRNPLFQVGFALVLGQPTTLSLSGLELDPMPLRSQQSKFDLTLTVIERAGQLQARFEYCTDLYAGGTIERLAGHFGVLLEGLLANPDQSIDTVPLMSDAERRQILAAGNEPALAAAGDQGLAPLFEAQVRRTPDAVAVSHADQTLTYAQLNARANQLAHYLRNCGVGPGVTVALCLERSPDLLVGLLGIVKAGGAYVPLDGDQPVERLGFLLEDSGTPLVLTQTALLGRLPAGAGQRWCLDGDWAEIADYSTDDPPNPSTPQQLAYVIYTSGSTGTPKGVAVRQQGVIRLVIQPNYVDLGPGDVLAQVANIAFDAATFEIWGALLNGSRLIILPRDTILSPPAFVAALRAKGVTCLFLTTALFNRVSSEIPDAFSSLRHVLFGGETCDPDRVRAVMRAGPPTRLVHVYGPTEATTFATFHVVQAKEERATIPIGRPISGTQVLLLDDRGELVPPGVVGEIHIGGPGVAAGYVNRPAETRARFIPSGIDPAGTALLYRTGDLARWLPDGEIEFLGRNDDQVKIRGFRIEPGEISTLLATHPQVHACHVLARQQASGDLALTAYVVLKSDSGELASPATLRAFLGARLPSHMVPLAFVPLTALPLTANGKVDTRALPEPEAPHALGSGGYAPPRDALERTVCQVWARVLKVERVGLDDNFFEIGGHSLLAARLFAQLDEAIGRPLTLGVLFTAPTVRQLADRYRDSATLVDEPTRALVALRQEGTRPTLYFLPGVFGNVVGYGDFVRELGTDQPIYGLQSIGLDGRAQPFTAIEAMASHYVAEIRLHQARGPYALVGACFGATVAYEMARQLIASGDVVAFLGLIAPTDRGGNETGERLVQAPRAVKRAAALANLVRARLRVYLQEMQGQNLLERLRYLARKAQSLSTTAVQPHGLKGAQRELNQLEVYRANLQALDRYVRRPLEGKLVAFEILDTEQPRAQATPGTQAAPVVDGSGIDWQEYWQGPLPVHILPGKDSGDMLAGTNAVEVARVLNERLHAAFDQSVSAASASPARQTAGSA